MNFDVGELYELCKKIIVPKFSVILLHDNTLHGDIKKLDNEEFDIKLKFVDSLDLNFNRNYKSGKFLTRFIENLDYIKAGILKDFKNAKVCSDFVIYIQDIKITTEIEISIHNDYSIFNKEICINLTASIKQIHNI